jgi:hypothetical protein
MAKQTKEKMRNLKQYSDMTDERFEEIWKSRVAGLQRSSDFEERINKKLEDFSKDYDIDDLKINDRESLRALIQATIALEDWEQILFRMRTDADLDTFDINSIDRISRVMSDLRGDIGRLQNDLNITRRVRKSDREASVINYIEDLKQKAKQFYEEKTSYVLCPKCNMLLATIWTLYPYSDNKITLTCNRPLGDGTICGERFSVTTEEMIENKNTNSNGVLPDSML